MKTYTVKVFTGNYMYLNTLDIIFIKLVGEDGESGWTWISGGWCLVSRGKPTFSLCCPKSIGKLVLVELNKQHLPLVPQHNWFVDKVEVTSPERDVYKFPIYHWLKRNKVYRFSEGKALRVFEDKHALGEYSRRKQLERRKIKYCWDKFQEGLPHCMKAEEIIALPSEVQFSFTKDINFRFTAAMGLLEMKLTRLADCKEPWTDFDAIYRVFCCHKTKVSEYVQQHWKEDAFFGYQFLNGLNPILIRCCKSLPENFSVHFKGDATFPEKMEKGNIFLCDYKHLDGVETNTINGKKQYLMAPLVLLHKTPDDELKPIAIQLKQTPAEDNPIFLPTDPEYDWLLAKAFVRSADFNEHQLNVHLLRTHLLAEVFAVSLLRNVPDTHPLYKLLIPHTRYSLQINLMARKGLISKDGVFTQYTASGGEGMITILKRSLSSLTYSSLCIPEDIKERGVESVPNYYYRDDGLKLWDIIHGFVKGVLTYYYKSNDDVKKDTELQNYIKDIFEHGFLSNEKTGIPQSFKTVDELVKFTTMVIFTCSAQHSAVNNGQFDFGGWMPNSPTSLQHPPPTRKGTATEETLLQTLPDVSTTAYALAAIQLLSTQSTDFVALGQYPNEYFSEDHPCELMIEFHEELKNLDEAIDDRNKNLKLPYTYLKPKVVENSVSI